MNEVSQTVSTKDKAVSFVFQVSTQSQPLVMVTAAANGTPFPSQIVPNGSLDDKQSFENLKTEAYYSGQKSQNCLIASSFQPIRTVPSVVEKGEMM